ncbi:hypothetical protein Tco_0727081 [Tanacetum coccineum]|uniref:Uncharacterized protein n=1 Tax=Tanacetum coccineum TaxID=301880 RepID=A0ABQ4YJN3_9ASTR
MEQRITKFGLKFFGKLKQEFEPFAAPSIKRHQFLFLSLIDAGIPRRADNGDVERVGKFKSYSFVVLLHVGTGSSSRLDDKVLRDKRQRDDNDLQDERQDQTDEEEVEPRRSKRARTRNRLDPILFLLW